jgi:hypothetical protein
MALLPGSPAIDAGDNTGAPDTDQRGFARIVGGTIDIGAFEVQPAGQATHLSIQAPASISAGTPFTITVTALDDFGQPAIAYTCTVHFVASNGAMADYTFTPTDMGTHAFSNLVLRRAGTLTVTGTDSGNDSINGGFTLVVSAAAADHIQITLLGSASAGTPFNLVVTIVDAYGNTVTDYAGTVHFTTDDPQAMLPADYTFTAADAGSHTFVGEVTLYADSSTITVTDTLMQTLTGSIVIMLG